MIFIKFSYDVDKYHHSILVIHVFKVELLNLERLIFYVLTHAVNYFNYTLMR